MKDEKEDRPLAKIAIRVGIAGAIGFGAVVSGLLLTRSGRRLVREAWEGRQRTRIEDRVLDKLWADPVLGKRVFEVEEVSEGVIRLVGRVRTSEEAEKAERLAQQVKGVTEVVARLRVGPRKSG